MLELRPNCECCNKDLPPGGHRCHDLQASNAPCRDCTETMLGGRCPNMRRRTRRPADKLAKCPPSTARVVKQDGCARMTA